MNSEFNNQTGNAEFAEIEAEINDLESYFGDLGLDDDDDQETSSSEQSELDIALAGSEFAVGSAESNGPSNFLDVADGVGETEGGGEQQEFLGIPNPATYLAKKAANKVIKWGLKYARKTKYRACANKLASAISAYKRRKYGTALKRAYSAAKCIRSKF